MRYVEAMSNNTWRTEVATLLEHAATSLRENKDRLAAGDLGAALAYLRRAEESGDKGAGIVMAQVTARPAGEHTERFTFAPGELEELEAQSVRRRQTRE
jgi:hypothetical protein